MSRVFAFGQIDFLCYFCMSLCIDNVHASQNQNGYQSCQPQTSIMLGSKQAFFVKKMVCITNQLYVMFNL